MKNDLQNFEKRLLKFLNIQENKRYTYKNLMEWSPSKSAVESNLEDGEKMYKVLGVYVAIRED